MYIFIGLVLIIIIGFFLLSKESNIDKDIKFKNFGGLKKGGYIIHISDIHYLSSKLTDYGKIYQEKIELVDAKPIKYIDKIIDSFILEIIDEKPDAVIIGGDISYNGEKISHEEISSKLNILIDKGIKVLVIPGNHDVNYKKSYSYFGDKEESTENIDESEFKKIYYKYGIGEDDRIISRDTASLSYFYKLSSNVNLLMLDTNTGKNINDISKTTFKWIEKLLKYSSSRNEFVISISHQNILVHNKMFAEGYRVSNASKLIDLFRKYNVRLNLSGHMHLQHISEYLGVYDASVGSIGLYPHLFSKVKIDEGNSVEYETEKLDIDKWMKKYKVKDQNLLNFKNYSKECFEKISNAHSEKILSNKNIDEDAMINMIKFMTESSISYFSGELFKNKELRKDNIYYDMWIKTCPNDFQTKYLDSIYTDDIFRNHNTLKIKL